MATSTIKMESARSVTDKISLSVNMTFAINANGNPYMRWTNGNNIYQIILSSSGISYQISTNGGTSWTDVWSNH
jgi:hypothetical protein